MSKAPDWAVGPHADVEPGVEVRPNGDGTIDEIVVRFPGGLFHLEQMGADQYWMALTWKDENGVERDQHIWLTRDGKRVFPAVCR